MATKSGRGSDKLVAALAPNRAKALQSAISGWKVIDWHQLGTPSPEVISAGISGSPARVGTVVSKLLKIKEIRDINILIHGIPRPDLAQVKFQLRNSAGR